MLKAFECQSTSCVHHKPLTMQKKLQRKILLCHEVVVLDLKLVRNPTSSPPPRGFAFYVADPISSVPNRAPGLRSH